MAARKGTKATAGVDDIMIHATHRGLIAAFLLLLLLLSAAPVMAQTAGDSAPDPVAVLEQQTNALADILRKADGETTSTEKEELRDAAMVVGSSANSAVALLVPQLAALDARIAELGEPTDAEAPDVKAQRAELAKERGDIDSAIKRGRLLAADAKEAVDRMIREINEAFNRSTFELAPSPLTPSLWRDVARSLPDDTARTFDFIRDSVAELPSERLAPRLTIVAASLAVALLLILPARRRLRHIGRRYAVDYAPNTRARRSGLALWFVLVGTLTSTLAFVALLIGLRWAGVLTPDTDHLARVMTVAASIGSFVISLGAGLLLVGQPSWRLLPISDEAAKRLRSYPGLTAVLTFFGVFLIEGGNTVGVSQAALIVLSYIVVFTYSALIIAVLVSLGRIRRSHAQAAEREPNVVTTLVTIATILAWASVAVSLLAAIQGYVNLGLFIGRQTIWTAIVAAATYLLLVVVDDLCTGLLSGDSAVGRSMHTGLGIRKSQISQLGVILSAILRIGILLLAVIMISGPFGPGASSLFYQFGETPEITVGGFTILPASILKAVVAFVIGILIIRTVRHWLDERFLPTTDLDSGTRNSVSTIVGYAGIIIVAFWALSALGVGLDRIGLVVSALSVGIGFGLQAITQNFISGLILLTERPVKIGDTVRIGTDEGDVKKISVRSTEIQIADRSTLIVPNSELITKTIRNMTLANPLGRIQIAFSAPIDVDVTAVRKALLDIYADHPGVLSDPPPSVFIDGIAGGQIAFNSFAFVSSPRNVYATRSTLFFTMLERLRKDGIPLVAPAAPAA